MGYGVFQTQIAGSDPAQMRESCSHLMTVPWTPRNETGSLSPVPSWTIVCITKPPQLALSRAALRLLGRVLWRKVHTASSVFPRKISEWNSSLCIGPGLCATLALVWRLTGCIGLVLFLCIWVIFHPICWSPVQLWGYSFWALSSHYNQAPGEGHHRVMQSL